MTGISLKSTISNNKSTQLNQQITKSKPNCHKNICLITLKTLLSDKKLKEGRNTSSFLKI